MSTLEFLPEDYETGHRDALLGLLALAEPDDLRLQGGTVVQTMGAEVTGLSVYGLYFDTKSGLPADDVANLYGHTARYLNSVDGFIGMFRRFCIQKLVSSLVLTGMSEGWLMRLTVCMLSRRFSKVKMKNQIGE